MSVDPRALAESIRDRLKAIMPEHRVMVDSQPEVAPVPERCLVYIEDRWVLDPGAKRSDPPEPWPEMGVEADLITLTFTRTSRCQMCKDQRVLYGIGNRIIECEECFPVFYYGTDPDSITEAILVFLRMTDDASGRY